MKNTLKSLYESGLIEEKYYQLFKQFQKSYIRACEDKEKAQTIFDEFVKHVLNESTNPRSFEAFHEREKEPVDFYSFGLDFIRPLINFPLSTIGGRENLDKIQEQLEKKENVILLANHQTEPDPQIISALLEDEYPQFAEDMIFVAGHRVVTDPMARPFSRGRNLLFIYSKRYMEDNKESKEEKLLHNQRTMRAMLELLIEGSRCIYVAPSGGRDRIDSSGYVDVAKFDPNSIELFYLLSKESKTPTHFYPFAMSTYDLLPPPKTIQKELGEKRAAKFSPVHISFGSEIDMENFPGSENLDKKNKRKARAEYIWQKVRDDYEKMHTQGSI